MTNTELNESEYCTNCRDLGTDEEAPDRYYCWLLERQLTADIYGTPKRTHECCDKMLARVNP